MCAGEVEGKLCCERACNVMSYQICYLDAARQQLIQDVVGAGGEKWINLNLSVLIATRLGGSGLSPV